MNVEKGIPIPPRAEWLGRAGRPLKYDWAELGVGDSVLVPDRAAVRSAYAFAASRQLDFRAVKQTVGERGWRVWRAS